MKREKLPFAISLVTILLIMTQSAFGQNTTRYDDPLYQTVNAVKELRGLFKKDGGGNGDIKKREGKTGKERKNGSTNGSVSLVTMGQGKSRDEAVMSALRSAIEQSFGAFISSKTVILNDMLMSDEIVSVSSGNVKKYDVLSELQNEDSYTVTIKAEVSVSKLAQFASSHGVSCSYDGSALANNIKLMKFRVDNTGKCLDHLMFQLKTYAEDAFTFSVNNVENPIKHGYVYSFPVEVSCYSTDVSNQMKKMVQSTLVELSLTDEEIDDYKNFVGTTKTLLTLDADYLDKNSYKTKRQEKKEGEYLLPGDQYKKLEDIWRILYNGLYNVNLVAEGTSVRQLLTKFSFSNHDYWRSCKVRMVVGDEVILHSVGEEGSETKKEFYKHGNADDILVLSPINKVVREDILGHTYLSDDRATLVGDLMFSRWETKKKRKGNEMYRIIVFFEVPEAFLEEMAGVSIMK